MRAKALTRPAGSASGASLYQGKIAAIVAASPGLLGCLRGLNHLRQILQGLNVLVIPEQLVISKANEAFDEAGALRDPRHQKTLAGIAARLVWIAGRLSGSTRAAQITRPS